MLLTPSLVSSKIDFTGILMRYAFILVVSSLLQVFLSLYFLRRSEELMCDWYARLFSRLSHLREEGAIRRRCLGGSPDSDRK